MGTCYIRVYDFGDEDDNCGKPSLGPSGLCREHALMKQASLRAKVDQLLSDLKRLEKELGNEAIRLDLCMWCIRPLSECICYYGEIRRAGVNHEKHWFVEMQSDEPS